MQETQVPSLAREDPLGKEMATHSSTLAWEIPWMEEPGRNLGKWYRWTYFQGRNRDRLVDTAGEGEGGVTWDSGTDIYTITTMCHPGSSAGKEPACDVGEPGSIPGSGRSPGEGKGYPLQYSGLEKSTGLYKSMGSQRVRHGWASFPFHFHGWNN